MVWLLKENIVNFAKMKSPISKYQRILLRKAATIFMVTASAIGSFAALGDGKIKGTEKGKTLNSAKKGYANTNFSLKSNYQYRGSQILNEHNEESFIMLNTNITLQKGNTTYIMPLKKKVIFENVKFSLNHYNNNY
jgi:hypothetical protein